MQLGNHTAKSKTCADGGIKPVWNETIMFNNIIYENELTLTVSRAAVTASCICMQLRYLRA